jgi:pimeloyl-ACP methyl ester carboxylesterase
MGALSDEQARCVGELVVRAGQRFVYVDLPDMVHSLHAQDPEAFTRIVSEWATSLATESVGGG